MGLSLDHEGLSVLCQEATTEENKRGMGISNPIPREKSKSGTIQLIFFICFSTYTTIRKYDHESIQTSFFSPNINRLKQLLQSSLIPFFTAYTLKSLTFSTGSPHSSHLYFILHSLLSGSNS